MKNSSNRHFRFHKTTTEINQNHDKSIKNKTKTPKPRPKIDKPEQPNNK